MDNQYLWDPIFDNALVDDYWMQQLQPGWASPTLSFPPTNNWWLDEQAQPLPWQPSSAMIPGPVSSMDHAGNLPVFVDNANEELAYALNIDSGPLIGNPPNLEGSTHHDSFLIHKKQNHVDSHKDNEHGPVAYPDYKPRILYSSKNCATCNAPLELTQQEANFENPSLYCTKDKNADHHPLSCDERRCGKTFPTFETLKAHSESTNHASFACTVQDCTARLAARRADIHGHFSEDHPENLFTCADCHAGFDLRSHLDGHGLEASHEAYICQFQGCDIKTTQMGDLIRHQLSHQKMSGKRHPCKYCRKYRGDNGFKRKDHLLQHIRNYHHIEERDLAPIYCPERRCGWCNHTRLIVLLDAHLLEIHHRKPYTCKHTSCDRVGLEGFDTKEQLKAHVKEDHVPEYPCAHLGCERVGEKGYAVRWALQKHMKKEHAGEEAEVTNDLTDTPKSDEDWMV